MLGKETLNALGILDLGVDEAGESNDDSIDLLAERITSIRNGDFQPMSTISQFTSILYRTGVPGPWNLEAINLKRRAIKIGSGSQFTVFREHEQFLGNEDLVIKRINIPLSWEDGKAFPSGSVYRLQLRTLELEILALCNPSLRNHRNIVRLISWGYDYPFPDTRVPVLFMEAAMMTLTEFLKVENEDLMGERPADIKYQLSLDIVAGLEALHSLHIVHGDVKPDNVLIFRETSSTVPFCAKISDFGVSIDMETSERILTIDDYRGTPTWLPPEVRDMSRWGVFKPDVMFRFDSFSLGLLLLSIFTRRGEPVSFVDGEDLIDVAIESLRSKDCISFGLRMQLTKTLRLLLAEDPWKRSLPCPELLRTDTPVFASWYGCLTPMFILLNSILTVIGFPSLRAAANQHPIMVPWTLPIIKVHCSGIN